MSTPKRGSSAYNRIFDPDTGVAPSSSRILHDIYLVPEAIKEIVRQHGIVIEDLNNRQGRRREAGGRSSKHGGKRTRLQAPNDYAYGRRPEVHVDALPAIGVKMECSKRLYQKELPSIPPQRTNDEPGQLVAYNCSQNMRNVCKSVLNNRDMNV